MHDARFDLFKNISRKRKRKVSGGGEILTYIQLVKKVSVQTSKLDAEVQVQPFKSYIMMKIESLVFDSIRHAMYVCNHQY